MNWCRLYVGEGKKKPKHVNRTSRAPVPAWQGAPTGKVSPTTLNLGCNNAAKASSKRGRLRGWQDSRTMGKNWEQRCRQRGGPWDKAEGEREAI